MIENLRKHLSKKDLIVLNTISYNSLSIQQESNFVDLVTQLQDFLEYENTTCAHGNVIEAFVNPNPSVSYLDISYPEGYADQYYRNGYLKTDTVIREFLLFNEPVSWRHVDRKYGINYPGISLAIDFGMIDGWAYGVLNNKTMECSMFFMGGPDRSSNARTGCVVEYAIPFLSEAYKRTLKTAKPTAPDLTPREAEVLNWIKEGKSSWETSVILKCSKRVVDFHVKNTLEKLDASNRTDAVVKALQLGVITF